MESVKNVSAWDWPMEAWSRYKDQFGWLWDQDLEADYYALRHRYSEALEFGLGALSLLKEKAAKTIQLSWRRYRVLKEE